MSVIAVFGSNDCLPGSFEYDCSVEVGNYLSEKGFDIATGGYGGVMEGALRGASHSSVRRIGITCKQLGNHIKNEFVTIEIETSSYLERLNELINIADAYIVLPGGTGTLLELAAIWALKERGLIGNKPLVCTGDQWLEVMQTMGFYSIQLLDNSALIVHTETAKEAVDKIIDCFK